MRDDTEETGSWRRSAGADSYLSSAGRAVEAGGVEACLAR